MRGISHAWLVCLSLRIRDDDLAVTSESDTLRFVFNELSARIPADTHDEGRRRMDDVVDALGVAMAGHPAELISVGEPSIWEATLAPGCSVRDWWAMADRDRRGFLGRIAGKTELPSEVSEALKERFYCSEFVPLGPNANDSQDARGLGAAYLLDGIGVSLPSENQWRRVRIPLRHLWLDDNCCERQEDIEALNLSRRRQAEQLSEILLQRRQSGLEGGPQALITRKTQCFPHLSFGLDLDGHLAKLSGAHVSLVIRKFITLDEAVREWRRDSRMASPRLSGCRPESEPTMQQYGHQRIFRDAEGQNRTYELHISAGSQRIHLRILHQDRAIEIGYVGKHLDTVKFH